MTDLELLEKMKQDKFIKNNGRVLRAINVLRIQFVGLSELQNGLSAELSGNEFVDCVNYLSEAGYINIRNKKTLAASCLADDNFSQLEAKVSAFGIKLLTGKIDDVCVSR